MSNKIPNELSSKFNTVEGRRILIQKYKDSKSMYSGTNSDGEDVTVSIAESGIVLKTNQCNGWVRVNYYDSEGFYEGESFEGRWK